MPAKAKVECADTDLIDGVIDEEGDDGWTAESLSCMQREHERVCCVLFKKKR